MLDGHGGASVGEVKAQCSSYLRGTTANCLKPPNLSGIRAPELQAEGRLQGSTWLLDVSAIVN
jgi:hypothetical protein